MNLGYVFEQGNAVLIAVFLLLGVMSFSSWYLIIWKALKLRREYQLYASFRAQHMQTPDWARHLPTGLVAGSIGVLLAGAEKVAPVLRKYNEAQRKEILSMHLSQDLDVIRSWLDKGLTVLASVGSSAPFIGLFGTVWGIYGALTKIATAGNAGLSVVAGPMGEALVATAIGLFAAIPAVLAYNAFVRLNRLLVQNLRHIAEQMTLYLSAQPVEQEKTKLREVAGARI